MTYGNCGECVFWRDAHGERFKAPNDQYGKCHAHAPVLFQTVQIGTTESRFPHTRATDGCGDFQKATK